MFDACNIEHGADQSLPDLGLFVAIVCYRTGGGPVAIVLVHLSDFLVEGHQLQDGVDFLGDGFLLGQATEWQNEQAASVEIAEKGIVHFISIIPIYLTQLTFAD